MQCLELQSYFYRSLFLLILLYVVLTLIVTYLFFWRWRGALQELYLKICRSNLKPGVISFSSKNNFYLLLPCPCRVLAIQITSIHFQNWHFRATQMIWRWDAIWMSIFFQFSLPRVQPFRTHPRACGVYQGPQL